GGGGNKWGGWGAGVGAGGWAVGAPPISSEHDFLPEPMIDVSLMTVILSPYQRRHLDINVSADDGRRAVFARQPADDTGRVNPIEKNALSRRSGHSFVELNF